MTRLQEIEQRYMNAQASINSLIKEYENKKRGEAFLTRYNQLVSKMEHAKNQALAYGSAGTVYKIKGKRSRIGKKNPKLRVQENFELYLVNIEGDDVKRIIELRFKNIIEYTIQVITPGVVITS